MDHHTEDHGELAIPIVASTAGAPQSTLRAAQGSVYIQITGTFTATYSIEGSIDGGETWWDVTGLWVNSAGAFVTAPIGAPDLFLLYGPRPPTMLRLFCETYSSGAPAAYYSFRTPS